MSETRVHEVRKEETTDNSSTEEDELFIGEITTTTAKNVLITNLKVNGKNVNFKIDTGAQCNVLPEEIFDGMDHLHYRLNFDIDNNFITA
jgi:hypothetical protein